MRQLADDYGCRSSGRAGSWVSCGTMHGLFGIHTPCNVTAGMNGHFLRPYPHRVHGCGRRSQISQLYTRDLAVQAALFGVMPVVAAMLLGDALNCVYSGALHLVVNSKSCSEVGFTVADHPTACPSSPYNHIICLVCRYSERMRQADVVCVDQPHLLLGFWTAAVLAARPAPGLWPQWPLGRHHRSNSCPGACMRPNSNVARRADWSERLHTGRQLSMFVWMLLMKASGCLARMYTRAVEARCSKVAGRPAHAT